MLARALDGPRATAIVSRSTRLSPREIRGCRLPRVTEAAPATRRRFLEASAGAALTSWLASVGSVCFPGGRSSDGGETLLGTLPFVGEGPFPVESTVGA